MDSDNRADARIDQDRTADRPTGPAPTPAPAAAPTPVQAPAPQADGPRPALWHYRLDDGLDPAGRIPVHAVRGSTPPGDGTDPAPGDGYRPNPRHGRPLPAPAPAPD
ncbi:hypothetical protein ACWEO5_25165, partial [Kitasatospora sp. NPDC004272]